MQDGRVDAACEALPAEVGVGADVVVPWRLCGSEDERVSLGGENLDRVDDERLVVHAVYFDDGLFFWERLLAWYEVCR